MKRVLLTIAVAAALALTGAPGHAAHSETQRYEAGPVGDHIIFCNGLGVDDVVILEEGNYGGACFNAQEGETSVIVTIADDLVPAVGLTLSFYNNAGTRIGDFVPGCVEARATLPPGTHFVGVYSDGPVFGMLDCGVPLSATSGEITATFA